MCPLRWYCPTELHLLPSLGLFLLMTSWPPLSSENRDAHACAGVSSCGLQTRRMWALRLSPLAPQGPPEELGRCTGGLEPETEEHSLNRDCDNFENPAAHFDQLTSMFSFCSTKNASPLSPSFMCRSTGSPLISMST